jgi:hypothetical protein
LHGKPLEQTTSLDPFRGFSVFRFEFKNSQVKKFADSQLRYIGKLACEKKKYNQPQRHEQELTVNFCFCSSLPLEKISGDEQVNYYVLVTTAWF